MKKGLISLCLAGALGFSGCITHETYNSTYNEHSVTFYSQGKTKIGANYLYLHSKEKNGGSVKFIDLDQDGRFDKIILDYVRNGDEVEKYANLGTGKEIINSITNKK